MAIRPPQGSEFNSAAQELFNQTLDTRAEEMSPQKTGRTAQYAQPPTAPYAQPASFSRDQYEEPLENFPDIDMPPPRTNLRQMSRNPSEIVQHVAGSTAIAFTLAKTWAIACLGFAVLYLAPQASTNPGVATLFTKAVSPLIVWPVFVMLFIFMTRARLAFWMRNFVKEVSGLVREQPGFPKLLAVVCGYVAVSYLLG